ncbi:MAG: RnfH family protein [Polaromonas sp.]
MAKIDIPASGAPLNISVVYSPEPRQVRQWAVSLPSGATLAQALAACGIFEEFAHLRASPLSLGIWGLKTPLTQPLQDADRIEIYRELRVDPKVARRERFNRQGAKRAGLFAKSRPGAKAGY